jgi:hypothetical protein
VAFVIQYTYRDYDFQHKSLEVPFMSSIVRGYPNYHHVEKLSQTTSKTRIPDALGWNHLVYIAALLNLHINWENAYLCRLLVRASEFEPSPAAIGVVVCAVVVRMPKFGPLSGWF